MGLPGFEWVTLDCSLPFRFGSASFICLHSEAQDKVIASWGMLFTEWIIGAQKKANRTMEACLKYLLTSCLLTFHQPNQVTWPRTTSVGRGSVFHPQWQAMQSHKAKDVDVSSYYREEKK